MLAFLDIVHTPAGLFTPNFGRILDDCVFQGPQERYTQQMPLVREWETTASVCLSHMTVTTKRFCVTVTRSRALLRGHGTRAQLRVRQLGRRVQLRGGRLQLAPRAHAARDHSCAHGHASASKSQVVSVSQRGLPALGPLRVIIVRHAAIRLSRWKHAFVRVVTCPQPRVCCVEDFIHKILGTVCSLFIPNWR